MSEALHGEIFWVTNRWEIIITAGGTFQRSVNKIVGGRNVTLEHLDPQTLQSILRQYVVVPCTAEYDPTRLALAVRGLSYVDGEWLIQTLREDYRQTAADQPIEWHYYDGLEKPTR